jgi:hypothetical protein
MLSLLTLAQNLLERLASVRNFYCSPIRRGYLCQQDDPPSNTRTMGVISDVEAGGSHEHSMLKPHAHGSNCLSRGRNEKSVLLVSVRHDEVEANPPSCILYDSWNRPAIRCPIINTVVTGRYVVTCMHVTLLHSVNLCYCLGMVIRFRSNGSGVWTTSIRRPKLLLIWTMKMISMPWL